MDKKFVRIRRAIRVRRKFQELGVIRLVVYRISRYIYVQVIVSNGFEVLVVVFIVEKVIVE